MVNLTSRLVAVPSENPGGDERAVADLIRRWWEAYGLPPFRLVGSPERPNLVSGIRFGHGGRHLGLCGHLDTKPVGDGTWKTDPLTPTVVDGELRGRGVVDMKGAIAAMLSAVARAATSLERGSVTVVLCADEEYGARHGARTFTTSDLEGVEAMVIGEPGGIHRDWDRLHLGSRGICNFDIEVTTRQAHSGLRDVLGLVSATEVAARLLVALADDFHSSYPAGGPTPTVNAGAVIEGGISYGVVPGRAVLSSECRLVAGMDRGSFERELRELVAARVPAGAEAEVTVQDWIPAASVPADHPVAEAGRRAVARVTETTPEDDLFPATTDATWFDALGIPTLPALGPGLLFHAHAPDEAVSLASLRQAVEVYGALIAGYTGGER